MGLATPQVPPKRLPAAAPAATPATPSLVIARLDEGRLESREIEIIEIHVVRSL